MFASKTLSNWKWNFLATVVEVVYFIIALIFSPSFNLKTFDNSVKVLLFHISMYLVLHIPKCLLTHERWAIEIYHFKWNTFCRPQWTVIFVHIKCTNNIFHEIFIMQCNPFMILLTFTYLKSCFFILVFSFLLTSPCLPIRLEWWWSHTVQLTEYYVRLIISLQRRVMVTASTAKQSRYNREFFSQILDM